MWIKAIAILLLLQSQISGVTNLEYRAIEEAVFSPEPVAPEASLARIVIRRDPSFAAPSQIVLFVYEDAIKVYLFEVDLPRNSHSLIEYADKLADSLGTSDPKILAPKIRVKRQAANPDAAQEFVRRLPGLRIRPKIQDNTYTYDGVQCLIKVETMSTTLVYELNTRTTLDEEDRALLAAISQLWKVYFPEQEFRNQLSPKTH